MRITILAPGSRGDVAPAAALGHALAGDGHVVTVTAEGQYGHLVTDAGLRHVAIDAGMTPDGTGLRAYLAALRTYMQAGAEAALEATPDADLILCNVVSPYGHDLAEAAGAHSADTLLQPARPSGAYPPMIASAKDLGPWGNRLAGEVAQKMPTPYDPACAWVRSQVGLKPESRRATQRRRRDTTVTHHGVSPAVLARPTDWPANLRLDGYWWPLEPAGWEPPQQLRDFLDAGDTPVVISLGSLPLEAATVAELERGLARGRHRVILQGEQLRDVAHSLGDECALCVGDAPHSWLLPRSCAVVHHAGAGVTAAALRAGVPSITVPVHTDQPFWARRLATLNAGTTPIPAKQLTAGLLTTSINDATDSPTLRRGAQALKAQLACDDGTAALRNWVRSLSA